jgi:hypothetical protein
MSSPCNARLRRVVQEGRKLLFLPSIRAIVAA